VTGEPPAPGPRKLVVVGLMGAGKTTVGRALAAWCSWPFVDSDAAIESATRMTVREIRAVHGTSELHALEARTLLDALDDPAPAVIAPAASVVDDDACRRALAAPDLLVLWLRARPETLALRFEAQAHRPRYGDDPRVFLAQQGAARDALFASVAGVTVDVDDRPVEQAIADARTAAEQHGMRRGGTR
jgi:shikimate kinase